MTFVVRVWVPSFVVVLSALLCPGRQVATRSSSPLGWFWSFPWPQVAPCLLWLGRSWGGMVKSPGLNFAPSLLNFSAASTSHFHFSTHHLAASSSLLPDHGMPAWDLLPPAAAHLLMRPLGILSTPSLSLPNMLLHWSKLKHTQKVDNLI